MPDYEDLILARQEMLMVFEDNPDTDIFTSEEREFFAELLYGEEE